MLTSPAMRQHSVWLWLLILAVMTGNAMLVALYPRWNTGLVPEWPVAIDLLLMLPLLYALVHRKEPRRALLGAVSLLGIGILVGSLILPPASKQLWLLLEQLRLLLIIAVLVVQVSLIALMALEVVGAGADTNLELAVDQAIARRFGSSGFSRLLRLEARMWLYALVRRPLRTGFPGEQQFHVHRQGENASNQAAFLIIMGAEIPLLHLLLHVSVGALAAMVVTILSVYGFIFLLAEYRATRLRPISIECGQLAIRHGITGDVRVALGAIAQVSRCSGPQRRAAGRLRLHGMGAANVRLVLQPGTQLETLLGLRDYHEILLGVDEPDAFIAAVMAESAQQRRD